MSDGAADQLQAGRTSAAAQGNSCPANPVAPCPIATCKKVWDGVDAHTSQVAGMSDVVARNRQISSDYAKLYQDQPDLKWAGTAAFASKQVGCGMTQGLGKQFAQGTLADGNKAVYEEIYPPLRFYDDAKKKGMSAAQISDCLDHKPGEPLAPEVRKAMAQLQAGQSNAAAMQMLEHEQKDTLQKAVYDSWIFRRQVDVNHATGNWFAPINMAFSADCDTTDSSKEVTFPASDGKLYNFEDRMPYATKVANTFIHLSEAPQTKSYMDGEIAKIAAFGH